eukprot:s831_g2.t3
MEKKCKDAQQAPDGVAASIGSRGHPEHCAWACRFMKREAGCINKEWFMSDRARTTQLEGGPVLKELCPRCHLCTWSKATLKKEQAAKKLQQASVSVAYAGIAQPVPFMLQAMEPATSSTFQAWQGEAEGPYETEALGSQHADVLPSGATSKPCSSALDASAEVTSAEGRTQTLRHEESNGSTALEGSPYSHGWNVSVEIQAPRVNLSALGGEPFNLRDVSQEYLPDFSHDQGIAFLSEFVAGSSIVMWVLIVLVPFFVSFRGKKRPYVAAMALRTLRAAFVVHILRIPTYLTTTLPGAAPHCQSVRWPSNFARPKGGWEENQKHVRTAPPLQQARLASHSFSCCAIARIFVDKIKPFRVPPPLVDLPNPLCVMSAFAVALLPIAAFAFRADVATNRTMATLMPDCSAWYENLPGKFKAKFGWTSADRKEYITKSPDPCAAVGLECCEGHCGLEGCEKELECLECRAKLAGVPGEVQKEICEDSQRPGST